MKKLNCILISLFMLGATLSVSAYDFSSQTRYSMAEALDSVLLYYSINPDGLTVSVTQGPATYNFGNAEIPETVTHDGKTYTVTEIARSAFAGGSINIVNMANTITGIGDYAFSSSSLNTILFSKNLKHIGNYAFQYTKLSSIDLPEGIVIIGDGAFRGDNGYTGNPLGKIRFATLPSTLKSIGTHAFQNNAYLNDVVIPDNIVSIKEYTFSNCIDLDKMTLSNKLQSIGDYAFEGCAFTEVIGGVETSSLKSSPIPIESTSLIIPPTLTTIGNGSFQSSKIKNVVLPNTITQVGNSSFSSTPLKSIKFSSSMTELPNGVCGYCSELIDVKIPNSITKIGERAFFGTALLSHIELPESITEIGNSAFSNSGLVSFDIPSAIDSIPAFLSDCDYLENIVIPEGVTYIGPNFLKNCISLKKISLPEGITHIPSYFAYGCKKLEEVNIPQSVTTIEDAFVQCSSLKNITIYHNMLKFLGSYSFMLCESLEEVHIKTAIPPTGSAFNQTGNHCKLYVPTGSKATYEVAPYWCTFDTIIEEEIGYDILYRVSANKVGQGEITINGEITSSLDILSGTNVSVKFTPASGWILKSVVLNDKDVTSSLVNNEYAVEALDANMVFTTTFEELPATLCLRSANGGTIDIPVVKGNKFTCKFTPDEGWLINNVRYNNTDVTASLTENNEYTTPIIKADAILSVSYETDNNSVETVGIDQDMIAYVLADGMLVVEGTSDDYLISVYDVDGRVLTSMRSINGRSTYQLPKQGVYIVKGISKSIKVGF